MAQRAIDPQIPPWIELPTGVWALIGSHLGTRDLARASIIIKELGAVQPPALNLTHTLTEINKKKELLWGLKRSSRVLSAVIELKSSDSHLFELCPMVLPKTSLFPCIQELTLDVCSDDWKAHNLMKNANAFGMSLLSRMPQLQLLELNAHMLYQLPLLPRLRHLVIVLDGHNPFPSRSALDSIAALPALQTLYCKVDYFGMVYEPEPQVVEMDLRTCVPLQAVCLVGMVPKEVLLPPAAKLTLDISASGKGKSVHCSGLRLEGIQQLWYLEHRVDFSMLSALSLCGLRGNSDALHLGSNARQLHFLSVTCTSENLSLRLSLSCLSSLIVHAAHRLELEFDDLTVNAARFDDVSIRWKGSSTMQKFEEALRAHCRKQLFAGDSGDSHWPERRPGRFAGTRQLENREEIGWWHQWCHPCTAALGACNACLKHCCSPVHPVPPVPMRLSVCLQ